MILTPLLYGFKHRTKMILNNTALWNTSLKFDKQRTDIIIINTSHGRILKHHKKRIKDLLLFIISTSESGSVSNVSRPSPRLF